MIVRNLDEAVVTALKVRAAAKNHSLEQELRLLLTESARLSRAEVIETAASIRILSEGRVLTDLDALIREGRER